MPTVGADSEHSMTGQTNWILTFNDLWVRQDDRCIVPDRVASVAGLTNSPFDVNDLKKATLDYPSRLFVTLSVASSGVRRAWNWVTRIGSRC